MYKGTTFCLVLTISSVTGLHACWFKNYLQLSSALSVNQVQCWTSFTRNTHDLFNQSTISWLQITQANLIYAYQRRWKLLKSVTSPLSTPSFFLHPPLFPSPTFSGA